MLFLTFRCGGADYALDAAAVRRVIPHVLLQPAPGAPPGVAGLLLLEEQPVTVLDLSLVLTGRAAPALYSTRIVLLKDAAAGRAALLLEHALRARRFAAADLEGGSLAGAAPYFRGTLCADGVSYQVIDAARVLSAVLPEAPQP